jgi:Protein of unknown function (DUF3396)
MEPPQTLYGQSATHFALRLFIRPETQVAGALLAELAEAFFAGLVLPECRPASLETKRPGIGAKLNMGAFSERRWRAAIKKALGGAYAVLAVQAETPVRPQEKVWLTLHVNPPGGEEFLAAGEISVMMSVSYLRRLAAAPGGLEAMLQFGRKAWDGVGGGPAYGFGNLAITPHRPPLLESGWRPGDPLPWEVNRVPAVRAHAIPVAYVGSDIDGNLQSLYCKDRGIKGAFWANYLSAAHVAMAGGGEQIGARLSGMRIEPLGHGGLLVVTTDSPLPDDTEENRQRFLALHAALQPAFLSREETPANKRAMLGYFYRERASVIP